MILQNKTKTTLILLVLVLCTSFYLSKNKFALANNAETSVTVLDDARGFVRWAIPEKRVGDSGVNDDTTFFLKFKNPQDHSFVYNTDIYSTTNGGEYLNPISLSGVSSGENYDIGIKTSAHLTKILRGINLINGDNYFNFTTNDNSNSKGSIRLVAGDVNGAGTSQETLGDDVVNSVDLSIMINQLDKDDPTGNNLRPNLNQDPVVNSVDLSLMVSNLDKEGER